MINYSTYSNYIYFREPNRFSKSHDFQYCFKHFAACSFRPGQENISRGGKSNHNHYVGIYILYIHHSEM